MRILLFFPVFWSITVALLSAQTVRRPVYSYNAGALVYSSPAVASDGTLYFGTEGNNAGRILALRPDLTLAWQFTTSDWVDSSPLFGLRGYVFAATWDGELLAFQPEGGLRWSYSLGGIILSSPAMAVDGTLYVATDDGILYALDPYSNPTAPVIQWAFLSKGKFISSPAITPNGTIIIGGKEPWGNNLYQGAVYAIHPDTGELLWQYLDEPAVTGDSSRILSSPAIDAAGNIYVGIGRNLVQNGTFIPGGGILSLTSQGHVRWEISHNDKVDSSPVLGADDSVYVATRAGFLLAYTSGGILKWTVEVGDVFYSSPTISSDGTIYVCGYIGGGTSRLFAMQDLGNSAQILWAADIAGYVDSSPTLGDNGLLYIGTYNGMILAFATDRSPSTSFWPKFRRDLRGRSNPAFASTRTAEDYFPGASIFGSGWVYWSAGEQGVLLYGNSFPWVYTYEHGWWYCFGNGGEVVWLFDLYPALSWLFTNQKTYPLFWSATPNLGWVYYIEGSKAPRHFYTLSGSLLEAP